MSNHPLIPQEEWVTDPSPDFDEPCPTCSALVENRKIHREFHVRLVELSERYIPPPVYGGQGGRH